MVVADRSCHHQSKLNRAAQVGCIWAKKDYGKRTHRLVDDGWSGKTQRDLLFAKPGRGAGLQGFSLDYRRTSAPERCGTQHVFLDYDREDRFQEVIRLLIWRHHILEDLFMCSDEGRCIGYRPSGSGVEPVLAGNSEVRFPSCRGWQRSVLDFAREWRKAGGVLARDDRGCCVVQQHGFFVRAAESPNELF